MQTLIIFEASESLTNEEWSKAGDAIAMQSRGLSNLALGDWLNAGVKFHGSKLWEEAKKITMLPRSALTNCARVASKIPAHLRRESLSFYHYSEIVKAKRDPEKWVAICEANELSKGRLKASLAVDELLAENTEPKTSHIKSWHRAIQETMSYFRQMKKKHGEDVSSWPDKVRVMALEDLQQIKKIIDELEQAAE